MNDRERLRQGLEDIMALEHGSIEPSRNKARKKANWGVLLGIVVIACLLGSAHWIFGLLFVCFVLSRSSLFYDMDIVRVRRR